MIAALLLAAALPAVAPAVRPVLPVAPGTVSADGVSGDVIIDGTTARATFVLIPNGRGSVRFAATAGRYYLPIEIDQPTTALLLLADPRFAFAAPALRAWAGADLVALRDRWLARLTAAVAAGGGEVAQTANESAVQPELASRFRLSAALAGLGRTDEAMAVIAAAGPRDPTGGGQQRVEYSLIAVRLAGIERTAGRDAAGIARLLAARQSMRPGDPYALNLDTNRAAMLVESGQAAEALALVDQVRREAAKRDALAGSERHFAWIRACALAQLGRDGEAHSEIPKFLPVTEPRDRQFVTDANADVARRGFACLGDVDRMVALLLRDLAQSAMGTRAYLIAQPDYRPLPAREAAFMATARADPRMQAAIRDRVVLLGPALAPALRGWR